MILLDTHALVWMKSNSALLSKAAVRAIREAAEQDTIAISAITLWELAWLSATSRITFLGSTDDFLEAVTERVTVLPLTAKIARVGAAFPATYPKDPADRIIGATALIEGIPLVTSDKQIRRSGKVRTIW